MLVRCGLGAVVAAAAMLASAGQAAQPAGGPEARPTAEVLGDAERFQSRFYQIVSDLPPEESRSVASHMDAVHEEYARRFGRFGKRNAEPLTLYVFDERQGYVDFLASVGIDGAGSAGMFFRTGDARGLAAFWKPRSMDAMLETLRHEGLHQFAYQRLHDDLPQWVNEGMAEYFGYAVLSEQRGRPRIIPGVADPGAIARLLRAAEAGTLFPLADLMAISGPEWNARVRTGDAQAGVQYDQSWSVVHFLVTAEGGRYEGLLIRYLELLWQGTDHDRARTQAFGRDLTEMEAAWHAYLDAMQPDELLVAQDRLAAWAWCVRALHTAGTMPADPADIPAAAESAGLTGEVPVRGGFRALTHGQASWWRDLPSNAKTGRAPTLRLVPDRRGTLPPMIELRGLRERVRVEWSAGEDGTPEPTVRIG